MSENPSDRVRAREYSTHTDSPPDWMVACDQPVHDRIAESKRNPNPDGTYEISLKEAHWGYLLTPHDSTVVIHIDEVYVNSQPLTVGNEGCVTLRCHEYDVSVTQQASDTRTLYVAIGGGGGDD